MKSTQSISRRDFLKLLGVSAFTIGGSSVLAACQAVLGPGVTQDSGNEQLRYRVKSSVISTPYFFGVPQIYAQQNGLFADNGIDVEIVETGAGAQVAVQPFQMFLAGQIDFSSVIFPNGFYPILEGAPVKGIGSFTSMHRHDYWMVTKVDIRDWMDFVGRKYVISSPGGPPQAIAEVGFRANGVPIDQIEYVSIGASSQRTQALLAGDVDAALVHPQDGIPILRENEGKLHLFSDMGKEYPLVFTMDGAMQETIEKERGKVVAWVKTHIQAIRLVASDQDLAVQAFLKEMPDSKPEDLARVWEIYKEQGVWDVNGGMDQELYDKTMDAYVESGGLPQKVAWEDFMDTSIMEEVLDDLGRL